MPQDSQCWPLSRSSRSSNFSFYCVDPASCSSEYLLKVKWELMLLLLPEHRRIDSRLSTFW